MHTVSIILDILGIIGCAGMIMLFRQLYDSVVTRAADGHVLEWIEEEQEPGRSPRFRARLAYRDAAGAEREALSADRFWGDDVANNPPGRTLKVVYAKAAPDSATIQASFAARWIVPVAMVAGGILCFIVSTKIDR